MECPKKELAQKADLDARKEAEMVAWIEETIRWADEQRLEKQRRRAGRKVAKFLAKEAKVDEGEEAGVGFVVHGFHAPPTLTCQNWLS